MCTCSAGVERRRNAGVSGVKMKEVGPELKKPGPKMKVPSMLLVLESPATLRVL
jgi:hypothetical protein